MLFNSFAFLVFYLLFFLAYWFLFRKQVRYQNLILLFGGYFFYGWWDWRFLALLAGISLANYIIGLKIGNASDRDKSCWLMAGLVLNVGLLIVFKYFNFFIDSFIDLAGLFGYELPRSTTRIILPLGISFYTFLSVSYLIDIKKELLKAERNPVNTLIALSFFPIIVAGPINRPINLLPQIRGKRNFSSSDAVDGLRQILWGLFAKVVIADNVASKVNEIFHGYSTQTGSMLFLGVILYAVQIYADFSGYSNIATGISSMLGFKIMQNFDYPYFSKDITEFWRKWHISLTTWFRDYIFLPLSFSISWRTKGEKVFLLKTDLFIYIVASIVTWFLTGLWHGADYTFVIWGMIHGFFLILYHIQQKPRIRLFKKRGINKNNIWLVAAERGLTLLIVLTGWIFFNSASLGQSLGYISGILTASFFTVPSINNRLLLVLILIVVFFFIEWKGRKDAYAIRNLAAGKHFIWRWTFYYALIVMIFYFSGNEKTFIYTQF